MTYPRELLELANSALIASEPKHADGWPRHEAAINATSCALHPPEEDPRREFARYHLGEPTTGQVFPKAPLLTDIQQRMVRKHGICPNCTTPALADCGRTMGLRFMGCITCGTVIVLEARKDDQPRVVLRSRRAGRVYLSQRVDLTMRLYGDRSLTEPQNDHPNHPNHPYCP